MAHTGDILRCFVNVNMAQGHDGLASLAKKYEIDVKKLSPGEYVVFINSARDRVKVYAASNVIAYQRLPHGRLDLRAIAEIPRVFKASGKISYDDALKEFLVKALAKRAKGHSPLQAYAAMKQAGVA